MIINALRKIASGASGVLVAAVAGCSADAKRALDDFDPGPTPIEYIAGETMYIGSCARCHGLQGVGATEGPPLVHKIYEPSHHADAAFQRAVQLGVVAHHWQFGPMAPVEGLPPEQIEQIIAYVRWLQRQAGIS